VAVLLTVIAGVLPAEAARPPAAKLLPENTIAMLSIADVRDLVARFQNTATGKMSQDPQLKPFIQRVYGAANEAMAEAKDRIGLSLPELLDLPQGELTVALVAPEGARPEVVALLDVGDRMSSARKVIDRAIEALDKSGSKKTEETIDGTKLVVYDTNGGGIRQVILFEKDNTVCFSSNLAIIKAMLAVWSGKKGRTLADNDRYATIASRCRGAADQPPQIMAYADPVAFLKSMAMENPGMAMTVAMLPVLGVDGLLGVGASMSMDAGQFDSVMHAHLLLDNPRTGVLEMIALESGDTTPEPWVPNNVAHYATLHWDFQKTVKKVAVVYDSFAGANAFATVFPAKFKTSTGIDFEKELLASLDGRATILVWIEDPITPQSQHMMLALKLRDPKVMQAALERSVKERERFFKKELYSGKEYYQAVIPGPPEGASPRPEGGQPRPCVGVLEDYLLLANQPGIYRRVIVTSADPSKSLREELDYKLIAGKIRRMSGGNAPGMIGFDRPDEGMRFLYGLATSEDVRKGIRSGGQGNPFLKSLGTALDEQPLPPFAVLQRYLAPGGVTVTDDETGLHYTAFSLRRKTD
jgi:hypothetical protein